MKNRFLRTICAALLVLGSFSFAWAGGDSLRVNYLSYTEAAEKAKEAHDYQAALNLYNKAAAEAKRYEDWSAYAKVLIRVSYIYNKSLSDKDRALSLSRKILSLVEEKLSDKDSVRADAYQLFAKLNYDDSEVAVKYLQKAVSVRKKAFSEMSRQVASTYADIGMVYSDADQLAQTKVYLDKAWAIRKAILPKDHPDLAESMNRYSCYYDSVGDLDQPQVYLRQAAAIYEAGGEKYARSLLSVEFNMGFNYYKKAYYDEAKVSLLNSLNKSLTLFGPNAHITNSIRNILGHTLMYLGEYDDAIAYLESIVRDFKTGSLINTYFNLGETYSKAGKREKAEACFAKAEHIYLSGQTNDSRGSLVYKAMGSHYGLYHQPARAIFYFKKSLELCIKVYGVDHHKTSLILYQLAKALEENGDYQQAAKYYQEALVCVTIPFNSADLFDNPSGKITILNKMQYADILEGKARVIERISSDEAADKRYMKLAYETYLLALQSGEELTQEQLLDDRSEWGTSRMVSLYDKGIRLAFELYQKEGKDKYAFEAFQLSEKSKAMSLMESMQKEYASRVAGIPEQQVQVRDRLAVDIRNYERSLFNALKSGDTTNQRNFNKILLEKKQELMKVLLETSKDYPVYQQVRQNRKIASVEDVRKELLNKDAALVEYFQGAKNLYVFVITPSGFLMRQHEAPDQVQAATQTFISHFLVAPELSALNKTSIRSYGQNAFEIYQSLLGDFLDQVRDRSPLRQLIVIPDGFVNNLPMEALVSRPPSNPSSYKQLHYVLNDVGVSYGGSASLIINMRSKQRHPNNGECLAMAPSYEGQTEQVSRGDFRTLRSGSLGALPGAQQEVRMIADYFDGKFLFGKEATKENFFKEAPDYAVLHLSMHAAVDTLSPAYSIMYFDGEDAGEKKSHLYNYELDGMQLMADLVVLSTCESGLGKYVRGEGTMSFARSFLHAGCPSVVQSLWKVDDKSATEMMKDFYKMLREGKSVDNALTSSKRRFLEQATELSAHPFFWAAFVLNGADQTVNLNKQATMGGSWLFYAALALIIGGVLAAFRRFRRQKLSL